MAKFDGEWRCFLVTFNNDAGRILRPVGKMNLRFDTSGELDEGRWEYSSRVVALKGIAIPGSHPRSLELETQSHSIFEGVQTFESGDGSRMVITGKYHVAGDNMVREILKEFTAQDDPPWVLTKP